MATHDGHRQRMRQRYLRTDLDGFTDHEILEFALFYAIPRQDTNPIAHRLIDRFGSLAGVLEAPISDIQAVEGVGEGAAVLLKLFLGVERRHMIERSNRGDIMSTTTRCGEYLLPRFFGERDEVVWLLCLDGKLKVLDCRLVSRGNINSVNFSTRKVVEVALSCNATSVVLAHNHPSGLATPSQEDIATTQRLKETLRAMEIALLDHIIIANDDFISMRDNALFVP